MRNALATAIKWSVLGRDRSIPHFERKFYHFLMGMACFSLYAFALNREEALLLLSTIGGVWVIADLFRLRFAAMNEMALRLFGKVMRREEIKSVSGNSFYILGLAVVVLLFPKPIVLLSVLFLAIGDPVAAMVGTLYGKTKIIGKKSLEGAVANFACSALASFVVGLMYFQLPLERALFLGVTGGAVSMAAELIPAPIDDNFSLPVFSAVFLTLISFFIPLFN